MKRTVFALLLLAAFGFSFLAGPHPCQAAHAKPSRSHSSCHEAGAPTGPSVARDVLSQVAQSCCNWACQHACHLVAVIAVQPMLLKVEPISQRLAEKADRHFPPFAQTIDHIPLA